MKRIYLELYKAPIYFLVCKSEEEAEKKFSSYGFKANWKGSIGKALSCENPEGNTIYGVWLKSKKDFGALAHEALHLAIFILTDRGISLDSNNDEPITYLMEYLINQFLKK